MATTRLKLKTGDRIAVHGSVTLITPQSDGRMFMTVALPNAPAPITLDTSWSNCVADDIDAGDDVRLEGKLTRIEPASDPAWSKATIRIDGYGYPVTLLMSDLVKA